MAENTTDAATPKPGHNGYDPERLQGFVAEHEEAQDKIDQIMSEAREKCEPFRAQQKDIKNECKKELGVPKGSFNHVLKQRRLEGKLSRIDEGLNEEERETADRVRHALGMRLGPDTKETFADTALGEAAVGQAAQ